LEGLSAARELNVAGQELHFIDDFDLFYHERVQAKPLVSGLERVGIGVPDASYVVSMNDDEFPLLVEEALQVPLIRFPFFLERHRLVPREGERAAPFQCYSTTRLEPRENKSLRQANGALVTGGPGSARQHSRCVKRLPGRRCRGRIRGHRRRGTRSAIGRHGRRGSGIFGVIAVPAAFGGPALACLGHRFEQAGNAVGGDEVTEMSDEPFRFVACVAGRWAGRFSSSATRSLRTPRAAGNRENRITSVAVQSDHSHNPGVDHPPNRLQLRLPG
jgi:hypothetical protein